MGMDDMSNIGLLDPSIIGDDYGDDPTDPRRRLMHQMQLRAVSSLMGGEDEDAESVESDAMVSARPTRMPTVGGPTNLPLGRDNSRVLTAGGNNDSNRDAGGSGGRDIFSELERNPDQISSMIMPPGFDDNGMPTEFEATGPKNAAAARLKRAQEDLYPTNMDTGDRLKRVAMTMLPAAIGLIGGGGAAGAGAAKGAAEGAVRNNQLRLAERGNAQQQYQFEAGREEREREMAMKEKLAMTQIEANKAYRTLMASISSRRADTQATNSEVNARGKGMAVVKGPDGVNRIVNLNPDQMTELQQAKLGVDAAQEELSKARTTAIPQQIKIAEDRLKIQQQMLQKSLAMLALAQEGMELRLRQEDYKETGPTMSSKNMAQMADPTMSHIQPLREQVAEAARRGLIGPAQGRVVSDFLAGKIGSTGNKDTDRFLGDMRTNAKLMTSAMLRTHFNGRGISLYGGFENMLAAKRSDQELFGTLDEFESYLGSYKGMADWKGADAWTPLRPADREAGPAAGRLKKSQPNSRTGNSGSTAPPPGARIRDYTQLGAH